MSKDVRGRAKNRPDDLSPGDRADPGLASVRDPDRLGPLNNAKGQSMFMKLTDTQLVMLSAAAQREDRCLIVAPKLKGAAAHIVANKLISAGFVEEIEAKAPATIWRRDNETGQTYALRLLSAGAKAIGIGGDGPENTKNEAAVMTNQDEAAVPSNEEANEAPQLKEPALGRPSAPRDGSKLARVIELLLRDYGATIDELIATTGWLAHTTRAALTGLRKRGYAVAINRSDKERGSFYRIQADDEGRSAARPVGEPADSPASGGPAQRLSKPRARRAA